MKLWKVIFADGETIRAYAYGAIEAKLNACFDTNKHVSEAIRVEVVL